MNNVTSTDPDACSVTAFARRGWIVFDTDATVLDWVRHALPAAQRAVTDPMLADWLDCDGTWFVGVDALQNDPVGRINGSGPLSGTAIDFVTNRMGHIPPLHPAQLSVVYPGYPRPRKNETQAAFRFRQNRDAAHVDGVLAREPGRRRRVQEPHAFILGIPLTVASADASPLVVWDGSHRIMRSAFARSFNGHDPSDWPDVDVTDNYTAARRQVFESCSRRPLQVLPGQAVLLHRMLLHGIAPWGKNATSDPGGRMMVYFRPEFPGGLQDWLKSP